MTPRPIERMPLLPEFLGELARRAAEVQRGGHPVRRRIARAMRYFLDTEFNGFGGALLSLALVPDDGGKNSTSRCNAICRCTPGSSVMCCLTWTRYRCASGPRLSRSDAARRSPSICSVSSSRNHRRLARGHRPILQPVDDRPGDDGRCARPYLQADAPSRVQHRGNSEVPHNALHDARALRDHLQDLLD
jgi:hypothetical protein